MRSGKVNLAYQYCIYDACYVGQMLHIILCNTDYEKMSNPTQIRGAADMSPLPNPYSLFKFVYYTICKSLSKVKEM